MLKKSGIKYLLFLPVLLLGIGIFVFSNSNVQLINIDINVANDCKLNKQILYNEPAYDNPLNITCHILPHDFDFSKNLYMRFIERVKYSFVEEEQIIVNDTIYTHKQVWFVDDIHYKIVNTSDYYYGVGQVEKAYKLINDEWFLIDGLVDILGGWLPTIPPNSSIDVSFNIFGAFHAFHSNPIPHGVYLFKKPAYQIVINEYMKWVHDFNKSSWVYLIVRI